jgi:hypothetical protein
MNDCRLLVRQENWDNSSEHPVEAAWIVSLGQQG